MSSGEMDVRTRDSIREIHCECGNLIKYDDIDLTCEFPKYGSLKCAKCGQEHRVILDGTLGKLIGARLL